MFRAMLVALAARLGFFRNGASAVAACGASAVAACGAQANG